MMNRMLVVMVVVCGCSVPDESEVQSELISDGAHGGLDGFYFLPPLVASADHDGVFDPSFAPRVEIRELGSNHVVTTYASTDITVGAEHYAVNWDTSDSNLDPTRSYRISVLLFNYEVGYADIDPVANGGELKNAATGDTIPLLNGRTLPVKFRLEQGVLDAVMPRVTLAVTPFFNGKTSGSGIASFAAAVTDVTFACRINGVEVACISPLSWPGVANGSTLVVEVAATSTITGIQGPTAVVTAVVDAAEPTISDVRPQGLNGTTVVAQFASSDVSADATLFTCTFDGQQFTPCEPGVPVTFTSVFDGPHSFTVIAVDAVGNASTFTSPFEVDGVGPVFDPALTVFPGSTVCPAATESDAILFFAEDARDSNPISYHCRLDGGARAPCDIDSERPRFVWTDLDDGEHVLEVVAFDRFGNPGDPLEIVFFADRVAPLVSVETPGSSATSGSLTVTMEEADGDDQDTSGDHLPVNITECFIIDAIGTSHTCTCSSIDSDGELWSCSFAGLAVGTATAHVSAEDDCGLVNSRIGTASWLVE